MIRRAGLVFFDFSSKHECTPRRKSCSLFIDNVSHNIPICYISVRSVMSWSCSSVVLLQVVFLQYCYNFHCARDPESHRCAAWSVTKCEIVRFLDLQRSLYLSFSFHEGKQKKAQFNFFYHDRVVVAHITGGGCVFLPFSSTSAKSSCLLSSSSRRLHWLLHTQELLLFNTLTKTEPPRCRDTKIHPLIQLWQKTNLMTTTIMAPTCDHWCWIKGVLLKLNVWLMLSYESFCPPQLK